jgi:HD-like signal output (HDOD) protein
MPKVAELIADDPTFSARLLQCVNSALFGLTYPVTDVLQAISIIGLDRTRQLTVTLAAAIYGQSPLRTAELRRCWEHTVATAILADQIAQGYGAFTDSAYAAGVMHDIGRLGLLVAYPKEYERVIRDAASQYLDVLDFERDHFGVDHTEAGRLLAEHWGLPEDFIIVAGRHHDPSEGRETDLLRIVHVACRLADTLGFEVSRPVKPIEVDTVLAELPTQARSRLLATADELHALVESRIRAFDTAVETNQARQPAPEPQSNKEEPKTRTARRSTRECTGWILIAAYIMLIAVLAVDQIPALQMAFSNFLLKINDTVSGWIGN